MKQKLSAILVVFTLVVSERSCAQQWFWPGVSTTLNVTGIFEWGDELFIGGGGGKLDSLESMSCQSTIVRLRQGEWDSLSMLFSDAECYDMALFNHNAFFTGTFRASYDSGIETLFYGIARYDGSTFSFLNDDTTGTNYCIGITGTTLMDVYCSEVYKENLYVGGNFNKPGCITTKGIAYWDGVHFHEVGGGINDVNGEVNDMVEYNGKLIVGGVFWTAGNLNNAVNIAAWDGQSWSKVNNSPFSYFFLINDMEVDTTNNFLLVGTDGYVLRYNGYDWSIVGSTPNMGTYVRSLAIYNHEIYAGGSAGFVLPNGSFSSLIRFDYNQWNDCLSGTSSGSQATSMLVFHDTLWVGGIEQPDSEPRIHNLGQFYYPPATHCRWLQPEIYTTMWPDTAISLSDSGTVHFMNNNAYSESWQWDFGDGATDTVQNPIHTYNSSGTYPVSVTVSMEGCTATATDTVYILPCVGVAENPAAAEYSLGANRPNPFSGTTVIPYTAPEGSSSELTITNQQGNTLQTIPLQSGTHEVEINVKGFAGGVYFYSLVVDGKVVETKKMVVE